MQNQKSISPALWVPPPQAEVEAFLATQLRLQTETQYLTIPCKLRVTTDKRRALVNAHKSLTNMKSQVLQLWKADLEQMRVGDTDRRLVITIFDALVQVGYDDVVLDHLRQALAHLSQQYQGIALCLHIVQATADYAYRCVGHDDRFQPLANCLLKHAHDRHDSRVKTKKGRSGEQLNDPNRRDTQLSNSLTKARQRTIAQMLRARDVTQQTDAETRQAELTSIEPDVQRQVHTIEMAILFRSYLSRYENTSSDVLLLLAITEAVAKGFDGGTQFLAGALSKTYRRFCPPDIYPLISSLIDIVFTECAELVAGWYEKYISYTLDQIEKDTSRTREEQRQAQQEFRSNFSGKICCELINLYTHWHTALTEYQQAARTMVPFGPHRGKTLGNPRREMNAPTTTLGPGVLGKHGARRLCKQLIDRETAQKVRNALAILLYPERFVKDDAQLVTQAQAQLHPWWRRKRQFSVRANRLAQNQRPAMGARVPLGKLTRRQQEQLYDQMGEMLEFATDFDAIRRNIAIFLRPSPPDFPSVQSVLYTSDEISRYAVEVQCQLPSYEKYRAQYDQALHWFTDFQPSNHTVDDMYSPEKLYDVERLAANRLEKAATWLREGKLHPLQFRRTVQPNMAAISFTLLYCRKLANSAHTHVVRRNRERYKYTLAVAVAGEGAPEWRELQQQAQLVQAQCRRLARGEEQPEYWFVNFPLLRFPGHSHMLYFPLEMGGEYQDDILQHVIAEQEIAPLKCVKGCRFAQTGAHTAACAPEAMITTLKLVPEWEGRWMDWYAHFSVPISVPPSDRIPDVVAGLHEYQEGDARGYTYAICSLDGRSLEYGDITLPKHLLIKPFHRAAKKNIAFECAVRMLEQCLGIKRDVQDRVECDPTGAPKRRYCPIIGLEDTSYRKEQVSLSAEENKQRFSWPSQRIAFILDYKAKIAGVLEPRTIKGVSPMRDCSRCGHRMKAGQSVRLKTVSKCWAYGCQSRRLIKEVLADGREFMRCADCERVWQARESIFKCSRCGAQQLARYNTAIAVAQRTLSFLHAGYRRMQANKD